MSFIYLVAVLFQNSYVDKLNNNTGNYWPDLFGTLGRFFSLSLVFIIILIVAYYFTRFISKQRGNNFNSNNIMIIESRAIGFSSNLQLVKVGEKYILIAVNKERTTFLADICKDDIVIDENVNILSNVPFEKYFKQFLKNDKKHDSGDES